MNHHLSLQMATGVIDGACVMQVQRCAHPTTQLCSVVDVTLHNTSLLSISLNPARCKRAFKGRS